MKTYTGWAVQWRSGPNNVDRRAMSHFCFDRTDPARCHPIVFKTRKAARQWAKSEYGYIVARRDLRRYPHDWKPVRVVPVTLTMEIKS